MAIMLDHYRSTTVFISGGFSVPPILTVLEIKQDSNRIIMFIFQTNENRPQIGQEMP